MTEMTLTLDSPLVRSEILGYMLFPGDEELRNKMRLTTIARAASIEGRAATLSAEELGTLSDGPGYNAMNELIRKAAQQGGIIAGETLIAFLQMRASNIEPSLGKAQYLLNSDIPRQKRSRDGRLPRGDRSLRNAWSEFKRVSHFWAARQLSLEAKMRECDLAEHPQNFLSLAVALFDTVASPTHTQPLLDADTWLPARGISPLSVSISPLANQQIEYLKKYKPRARD